MKLLLVPAFGPGMGSGHLRRCLALANRWAGEAALLLEDCRSRSGRGPEELLAPLLAGLAQPRVLASLDPVEPWDLVLLDCRSTDRAALRRFARLPALGLDEGGPARKYLPYLADTPLAGRRAHSPNLASCGFLETSPRTAGWAYPFRRVLLSFGGEDAADLSGRLLERLLGWGLFRAGDLSVVQGPYFRRDQWPRGVRVLVNPPLRSLLPDFDLVFTAFGLTAFEALSAGVPVITFNPSRYHRRLAKAEGLPEIGVRRPVKRRLSELLADRGAFDRLLASRGAAGQQPAPGVGPSLAHGPAAGPIAPPEAGADPSAEVLERLPPERLLPALLPAATAACPVCGGTLNPALARFPRRTYFRCRTCRIVYLASFGVRARAYGESYFFEEYRRQYGRTYLQDFASIQSAGSRRLEILLRLLPRRERLRLLDVGCAYGPFLQAAREEGVQVEGLDLSAEAARYVRERLNIPCAHGDFLQAPIAGRGFDVLTMWYVLEHFRDAAGALARANELLRPGGLLAFSTPSAAGVSARRNLLGFLRSSPEDHFTVWSPRLAGALLRRFGFRLARIRITGHHPERFPGRFPAGALLAASRLLGLGDTFEAYAVKTGDPA